MEETNQFFSQGINERFAHEIAHQYWGHVVKMPSHEEQWLTESFAEYSAAIFLKAFKGKTTYNSLLAHWKSDASQATKISPIPLDNRISIPGDPRTAFLYRTDLIYDKGSWLLAALHRELGDQMFLTFLKSYQKSFRWKFGSTRTVEGILQWLTKKDYGPFFAANYWGTGMPSD
jgi:aminopeptidase N